MGRRIIPVGERVGRRPVCYCGGKWLYNTHTMAKEGKALYEVDYPVTTARL